MGAGERAKREPALRSLAAYSIRTIPPKLCVGTRERAADHLLAARISRAARAFRSRTKHSPPFVAVLPLTAPLRLGLLIVLELLVRRIIELQLLPRVMKVDATAAALARERAPIMREFDRVD